MNTHASEAFFLYAETYLPDALNGHATLAALASCATGTERATPSVATYVFRPSALSAHVGKERFPGAFALESTELYLTHRAFRDHLETEEFRTGLRAMYKQVARLGARIFWIGARPPSDMLHNIFRSDPLARPAATVVERLFDEAVYRSAPHRNHAIFSLLVTTASGSGAKAVDMIETLAASLRTVSLVAFFHPLALDMLRLFFVAPIDDAQPADMVVSALAPFAQLCRDGQRPMASVNLHAARADSVAPIAQHFHRLGFVSEVSSDNHRGYIVHPNITLPA
jgi:hypothetical protein